MPRSQREAPPIERSGKRRLPVVLERWVALGTERTTDIAERRRIRVTNGAALIAILVVSFFLIWFLANGREELWRGQLIWALGFAAVLFLNHKGRTRAASIVLVVTANLSTLWSFLLLGLDRHATLFFACIALPFMVFAPRARAYVLGGLLLSLVLATYMMVGTSGLPHLLRSEDDLAIRGVITLSSCVALALVLSVFASESARAEGALEAQLHRVRQILAGTDQGIITISAAGLVGEERSAIFDAWFGRVTPGTALSVCFDRWFPDAGAAFAEGVARLVADDATTLTALPTNVSNGVLHFRITYQPVARDTGLRDGILVIMTDITAELEREHLNAALAHAERLKTVGNIAARLAHELNTPAQYVADSLALLEAMLPDILALPSLYRQIFNRLPLEEAHDEALRAEEAADVEGFRAEATPAIERAKTGMLRIAALVRELKDATDPTAPQVGYVDLNQVLRESLLLAHSDLDAVADVEVDLRELPRVHCDARQIGHAFVLLITHVASAVAHGSPGSLRPRREHVRVSSRSRSADAVQIEIAATGTGMPDDAPSRLPEPPNPPGNGNQTPDQSLGRCRMILERHGGTVLLESKIGVGTTWRVQLPVKRL